MVDNTDSLAYVYTQETTIHGLGRAVNKDKSLVKRACWVVFFLACAALFLYFLCDAFMLYFQFPVSTKLTYNNEDSLDFPSVTLCNYNKVTASYLAEKNDPLLNATVAYLDSPIRSRPPSQQLQDYMKTVDAEEFYLNAAHRLEDTYRLCIFYGLEPNVTEGSRPVCQFPDDAIERTITEMGVCHTFHPQSYVKKHGVLRSKRAGSIGGMSFGINIAQNEYRLGGFSAGMKVLVHDPKVSPRVFELGSGLEPGTDVYLVMKKNEMINLPYPYARKDDSCVDTEARGYVNPLKYNEYYSYAACLREQVVEAMLQRCQCVDFFFYEPGLRICNLYEADTCALPARAELFTTDNAPRCPKPCKDVQYEASLSQSFYPNDYKVALLSQMLGINPEYFAKNIISLNVYFGELGYTLIEQERAYTFAATIASIGGYMGLCLGASILTLFELFELIWDYCAQCTKNEAVKTSKVADGKDTVSKPDEMKSNDEKKLKDYPQFPDYAT